MLFNSIDFAIFFPIVLILYWVATKGDLKRQNILLLVASYFFYACWDYRFLFLLIFSTLLDYFTGIKMHEAGSKIRKRFWFWLSICINLGFLGIFKYFNFFSQSFADALSLLGIHTSFLTLNVILPVGISFYTFHGLSYVIDIYNDKIKPERNFIDYSLFVSFFPLLVAGPIERATHLLPQIKTKRVFNYSKAIDGLRQMLWGLFKKIVIADNCAEYANMAFNSGAHSGSTLLLGALLFTFQIYCDFSGYSDIALGAARLMGIELLRNFAFPYFSRDIAEFWRRWHISLSSWFRDYLYIPLGGSKGGTWIKVRNTFIIFLVSGFWHGANWTFIFWGLLNALYIMPSILFNTNRNNLDIVASEKYFPSIKDLLSIILTFSLTVFAWIFFRSDSIHAAFSYISGICNTSLFTIPDKLNIHFILILVIFVMAEWLQRTKQHALQFEEGSNIKYYSIVAVNCIVIWAILLWGVFGNKSFIYFQF
ncbi:MAG: MBOAT family protein [Ferruginibacter sp.]|nr:MBOAT family protein [Ferruginibacter sp.]